KAVIFSIPAGIVATLKRDHLDSFDAVDALRRGNPPTEIDCLREREVIRMKQTEQTIAPHTAGEDFEQSQLDIAAEITGPYVHLQTEFRRYRLRRIDFKIQPRHAIRLQFSPQLALEIWINREAAQPVDTHKHGVPASGPAQRPGGALHTGEVRRLRRVIARRNSAKLLVSKCERRLLPRLLDRLRLNAAAGW